MSRAVRHESPRVRRTYGVRHSHRARSPARPLPRRQSHAQHDAGLPTDDRRDPAPRDGRALGRRGGHRDRRRLRASPSPTWADEPPSSPTACAASASPATSASARSCGTTPSTSRPTSPCPSHGRGAAHAQHPAVPRAAHLHRQPRRGPGRHRRRLARAAAREGRCRRSRPSSTYVVVGRRRLADLARRQRRSAATRTLLAGRAGPLRLARARRARRRRRCATRAAPPATRRASSTATARRTCTRMAVGMGATRRASPSATACCRSCRCSTPTPGACRTRALMAGADLVMPDRFLQAEPLAQLIADERVRPSPARVPTIWTDLLRYARRAPRRRPLVAAAGRCAAARRCPRR